MKTRHTRPEQSGERNLDFSGWVRENLPDSYDGFRVSDLDFILANVKTKKIMLLEQKIYAGKTRNWQKELFSYVNRWISTGIENENPDWEYLGFHTVVFEKTFPENGKIWFDGQLVTKEELRDKLSF
jgi:hypothetical protein